MNFLSKKKKENKECIRILGAAKVSRTQQNGIIPIVEEGLLKGLSKKEIQESIKQNLNVACNIYIYNYPEKKEIYVVI